MCRFHQSGQRGGMTVAAYNPVAITMVLMPSQIFTKYNTKLSQFMLYSLWLSKNNLVVSRGGDGSVKVVTKYIDRPQIHSRSTAPLAIWLYAFCFASGDRCLVSFETKL